MIYKYSDTTMPIEKVGGKAYNLAHLSKIRRIKVPKWVCLPTDIFYQFLGDKRSEYESLLKNYTSKKRDKIIAVLKECTFGDKLKEEIKNAVLEVFSQDKKFAIRSSATDEDSDKYSFAGMLDSSLNSPSTSRK